MTDKKKLLNYQMLIIFNKNEKFTKDNVLSFAKDKNLLDYVKYRDNVISNSIDVEISKYAIKVNFSYFGKLLFNYKQFILDFSKVLLYDECIYRYYKIYRKKVDFNKVFNDSLLVLDKKVVQ